jgi:hypothetical protein
MICPLCIDDCEQLARPFPFCPSCLTTLRTFVRTEKQRKRVPALAIVVHVLHPPPPEKG